MSLRTDQLNAMLDVIAYDGLMASLNHGAIECRISRAHDMGSEITYYVHFGARMQALIDVRSLLILVDRANLLDWLSRTSWAPYHFYYHTQNGELQEWNQGGGE